MDGKERRVLTYYFPLVYTYFPLHMRSPIIHDIFSFRKIIIVIIVYGRKRKTCINVLLSFSIYILFFAHKLTHNSCHFFFWRITIDIIVYERKRKTCIIFRRKINGIIILWKEKKICIVFEKKINNIIAWWKKN